MDFFIRCCQTRLRKGSKTFNKNRLAKVQNKDAFFTLLREVAACNILALK